MNHIHPFSFRRARGIVWVCDIEKSSGFLNDDDAVNDIENFIPRFYYVAKMLVESYHGVFLKWTGDGFLAWFEVELDRDKKFRAVEIFKAAWHLTFQSNVTQMGLNPSRKIKIRNGITFEQDALLMSIQENGYETMDIIGRQVVLAFRLSGIKSDFPTINTTGELAAFDRSRFIKWKPTSEDKLKFFKGEKYQTGNIYITVDKRPKKFSPKSFVNRSKKIIADIQKGIPEGSANGVHVFYQKMKSGPQWCQDIIAREEQYAGGELLPALIQAVEFLGKIKPSDIKNNNS